MSSYESIDNALDPTCRYRCSTCGAVFVMADGHDCPSAAKPSPPVDRPAPTRTVTLSDGSVWRYSPTGGLKPWFRLNERSIHRRTLPSLGVSSEPRLTASDHRAIADVLDPPKGICDHCQENIYHDDN